MKNHSKLINMVCFGMDQRTLKILEMIFRGPGKGDYALIEEIQSAQACVFDLDSLKGKNFWNEYRVLYPQLPTIVLSINEKDIAGTIYIKKPIEINELVKALKKIKQFLDESWISEAAQKISTKETVHPLSSRPCDAKLATEIATLEEEKTLHQYCGYAQDVNLNQSKTIEKVYYDPNQYLQGFFEKAVVIGQQFNEGGVLIEGLYKPVILVCKQNQIYCESSFTNDKLRTMTQLPLSPSHLSMKTLNEVELEQYMTTHRLSSQPLDNFLWQVALWTARGRIPKGTDLHKKIVLLYWPNFTCLVVTPYALKISALWMEHPSSLSETTQNLKIPQRYVFAFFSATSALKLAFVDRRFKPRTSSSQQSSMLPSNVKRSLFQRILARLRR